jgi:hypothetical protein
VKKIITAAGILALVVSLSACHSGSASDGASGLAAKATSSAAQQDEKTAQAYLKPCIPQSSVDQITWGKGLIEPGSAGKHNREKFTTCVGIPASQRTAFEAAALSAAEKVNWTSKSARKTYFGVTLVNLVEKYHTSTTAFYPTPTGQPSRTVQYFEES